MNLRSLVLLSASITALSAGVAACGGSGSSPKIRSFTANPATVPSLGADVTLVWDVSRADELQLEPDVGAVTGTSATVHVTETTTFTLTAKKDGRSAHKRTTVTVAGPNAVTGTVRSVLTQQPLANMLVWIKGKGATFTAADGTFTFDDVETPYDIAVVDQPFGGVVTIVYLGVTRPDPILEVTGVGTPPFPNFVNLTGTLTPPTPAETQTRLYLDTNQGAPLANPVPDSYGPISASWNGEETYDFNVHALRFTLDTAGNISSYSAYGRTVVSATNGIATVADVTLTPTTTDRTSGTVNLPNNTELLDVLGFMIFGTPTGSFEDVGFFLPSDGVNATGPDTWELASPALSGAIVGGRFDLRNPITNDTAFAYVVLDPGSTGNELDLPAPPRLLLPIDEAAISRDQTFQIAGRDDSLKVYEFSVGTFPPQELVVITTENEITLPDTREIGQDMFGFSSFSWHVYAEIAPRSSIDEALGDEGIPGTSPAWLGSTSPLTVHPFSVSP